MLKFTSPITMTSKEAAALLTHKGFIRWCWGKTLNRKDFKNE